MRSRRSPTLTHRAADAWACSFMLDPVRPVRQVSAGAGLVVAGGDAIHLLRPGNVRPAHRALAGSAGRALVAVEPWAPFRYALATVGRLQTRSGRDPDMELLALQFTTPDAEPTHLAWARTDGESLLYLRGRDSALRRLRPDREAIEELDSPALVAIASDASGSLATLDVVEDLDATLTRNGTPDRESRPIDTFTVPEPDDEHGADGNGVQLAVSGAAIAYSIEGLGTFVSWGEGDEFHHCPELMWGPIAFQGDEALVCAYGVEEKSRVCRRSRQGDVRCLFELATEWSPGAALEITAITWDPTRRCLWCASPNAGWLQAHEPAADRTRGALLS